MQRHFFQIVDKSPWPFFSSFSLFFFFFSIILYFNNIKYALVFFYLSLFLIFCIMFFWWTDIIKEGNYLGYQTKKVIKNYKVGIILFIVSEVVFFLTFFWSFFYFSLFSHFNLGLIWPPEGIITMKVYNIPLLNSFILLYSGLLLTIVHNLIIEGVIKNNEKLMWTDLNFILGNIIYIKKLFIENELKYFFYNLKNLILIKFFFILTIICGIIFLSLQFLEYLYAPYSIADSVYGSIFFFITGFHGIHVVIGLIYIIINYIRFINYSIEPEQNVGLEGAVWYWHFVDVIWLFVFLIIYWWGNN